MENRADTVVRLWRKLQKVSAVRKNLDAVNHCLPGNRYPDHKGNKTYQKSVGKVTAENYNLSREFEEAFEALSLEETEQFTYTIKNL